MFLRWLLQASVTSCANRNHVKPIHPGVAKVMMVAAGFCAAIAKKILSWRHNAFANSVANCPSSSCLIRGSQQSKFGVLSQQCTASVGLITLAIIGADCLGVDFAVSFGLLTFLVFVCLVPLLLRFFGANDVGVVPSGRSRLSFFTMGSSVLSISLSFSFFGVHAESLSAWMLKSNSGVI